MKTGMGGACAIMLMFAATLVFAEMEKRPLYVNNVEELGLRILTEVNPKWSVQLEMNHSNQYMVRAAPPSRTYPPGEMVWLVLPEVLSTKDELQLVAYKAVLGHVDRFSAVNARPRMKDLRAASYGDLSGYEWGFSGVIEDVSTDVRLFVGNKPGKPLVLMQATTQHGKMMHLNEQIRRSWTNVRYLDEASRQRTKR